MNYAIDGIIGFSTRPLRLATYLGCTTAAASLVYLLTVILQKLLVGIEVPGYATIIVLILLLGGMQLLCIGIIGEYVGRTFEQTKNRPIYIAKEILDYEN
jgi:glycosyltransferase involved in cell wall biosynthesis